LTSLLLKLKLTVNVLSVCGSILDEIIV